MADMEFFYNDLININLYLGAIHKSMINEVS